MELKCWALRSTGSTTPYVGSKELQFQNPWLRWHDALYFPCVGSWWAISVCSWLHVIAGVQKRCVTMVAKGWDDPIDDVSLRQVVEEVLARVTRDDPVQCNWSVFREELNAWVDASSLATDMVLERCGDILEDECWLHPTNNA